MSAWRVSRPGHGSSSGKWSRSVLVEQQHSRRLAHQVAAAHHHGVLPGMGIPLRLRISMTQRGCKEPAPVARLQEARIDGLKAVTSLPEGLRPAPSLRPPAWAAATESECVDLIASIEAGHQVEQLAVVTVSGRVSDRCKCRLRRRFSLCCGHRSQTRPHCYQTANPAGCCPASAHLLATSA